MNTLPRGRITVSGTPEAKTELQPVAHDAVRDLIASPRLQLILDGLASIDEMHSLHEQVAAWETIQKRMAAATQEIIRIAAVRLRLERKIGAHLAQTVRRGGHRARSHYATSTARIGGLPSFINKHKARWYRQLAAVSDEVFESYLEARASNGKPPSANGLIRTVLHKSTERSRTRSAKAAPYPFCGPENQQPEQVALTAEVVDAVSRLLDVTLIVGECSAWPDAKRVSPDVLRWSHLTGNVLVVTCPDPANWLPKLVGARTNGIVAQVVISLPLEPTEKWFKRLEIGGWFCCFRRDRGVLAYLGGRTHACKLAFDGLGTVLGA